VSIVYFLCYSMMLALVMIATVGAANWFLAKKDGKKFVGIAVALSDEVGRKAFLGLVVILFVMSCCIVLALSAGHIIGI